MAAGDWMVKCAKCGQVYYGINGHDCPMKENDIHLSNLEIENTELKNKINVLLDLYNGLPMLVKLYIPPKIRTAIENLKQ